jgi:O-antigen/teichoic acid export membrane protein
LDVYFTSVGTAIGMAIVPVSVISLAAIFLLRGQITPILYPLLLIGVTTYVAQAVYNTLMDIAVAQRKSVLYTTFQLITRYGGIGLSLLLVIGFGLRIEGLMWGALLVYIVTIPLLVVLTTKGTKISLGDVHLSEVARLWRYAWPLALGNMAMWGLRLSDRYVLSLFRAESEVGLYSVAYNLSGKSVDLLAGLFALSMFPILMKVWESQGRVATENALAMFTRLYLILGLPMATGLALFASPFVSIFTSDAYHGGYRVVGYVAFSAFIWQLSQIASYGILIKQKTKLIAANQIAAAFVNLGLTLLLVPRYGYVMAGVTTLVGYLVLFALQAHSSRAYLTWRFPWRTMRNSIVATVFMGVVSLAIYGLSGNIMELRVIYLLPSVAVAMLAYFVSLWLLGEANEEERAVANRLRQRIGAMARVGSS